MGVESEFGEEMPPDESSESNTCRVNEPQTHNPHTHEQTQMELESLKKRVHKAEAAAEKAQERLRFQGNLLIAWRRKLNDQETLIRRLRQEKEREMKKIATNLLMVEAELRKEQTDILRLVKEKDDLVSFQEQQIHALVVLNRKLAAIAGQQQRHSNLQRKRCNQTRRSVSAGAESLRCNLNSNIDELVGEKETNDGTNVEGKENLIPPINEDDSVISQLRIPWDKSCGRHVPTLEALDEVVEELMATVDEGENANEDAADENNGEVLDNDKLVKRKKNLSSQTASFNRVMSTHRNVTKPKDVKYKKINRVKSRSLEELRGKLRNWTHPFFVAEKFS